MVIRIGGLFEKGQRDLKQAGRKMLQKPVDRCAFAERSQMILKRNRNRFLILLSRPGKRRCRIDSAGEQHDRSAHDSRIPPSIRIVCPVMYAHVADARNATSSATSCGLPTRFSGLSCSMSFKSSAVSFQSRIQSVAIDPGAMQFTWTLGAKARA